MPLYVFKLIQNYRSTEAEKSIDGKQGRMRNHLADPDLRGEERRIVHSFGHLADPKGGGIAHSFGGSRGGGLAQLFGESRRGVAHSFGGSGERNVHLFGGSRERIDHSFGGFSGGLGGGGLCFHLADPEGVVCNRLADPEGGRGGKLKGYMFASLRDYFIYCFDC